MTLNEEYWERWLRAETKAAQSALAEPGHRSCPVPLRDRLSEVFSAQALAQLNRAGHPQRVHSIWDLDPGLLTEPGVAALGEALASAPEYLTRVKIISLLGKALGPYQSAFSALRDHFWRVDPATDPPENSERYMCWSSADRHATAASIGDLVAATRATNHGSARSPAILTLGRFPGHANEFQAALRECLVDPQVAPAAAEVLAKIGDSDALPLIEESLATLADQVVHRQAFRERLTNAILQLRTGNR